MIKGLYAIVFIAIFSGVASGQEKQTLENTMQEISKDLAALHREVEDTYKAQVGYFKQDYYMVHITSKQAPIRAGADGKAQILSNASLGNTFNVIDKAGEWYAVSFKNPINDLTSGWVKSSDVVPVQIKRATLFAEREVADVKPTGEKSVSDRIYEQLTKYVMSIRDKYQNNPYVRVTGFTVNVTVPPSVSVSFEFK